MKCLLMRSFDDFTRHQHARCLVILSGPIAGVSNVLEVFNLLNAGCSTLLLL